PYVVDFTYTTNIYVYYDFYKYLDHRELHSFPTRRSSDLKEVEERDKTRIMGVDLGIANFAYTAFSFDNWLRYSIEGNEILEFKRDRKSTRLNSSHVSISYAVFCLKKKKQ